MYNYREHIEIFLFFLKKISFISLQKTVVINSLSLLLLNLGRCVLSRNATGWTICPMVRPIGKYTS